MPDPGQEIAIRDSGQYLSLENAHQLKYRRVTDWAVPTKLTQNSGVWITESVAFLS